MVKDKLTLFSVTLVKVAMNGLANPPGIYQPIPNANVKIQILKIPITFVFFLPVTESLSGWSFACLIWRCNLSIINYVIITLNKKIN